MIRTVTTKLFRESAEAFKRALAAEMGCAPEDYQSHGLAIVGRPTASREPHLALATTCGAGSVLSVRDPRLGDWARQQQLNANQRVFLPSFLEDLAAYARELGHEGAKAHSASGGTVLAEDLPARELPPGFALRELSLSEREQWRVGGEFDNALGEPEERRRIAASRIAFAVVDPTGAPVAVTGIWDQYPGVDELGLDVLRTFRGNGFAAVLTIHATRWIRSQGRLPIYTYGFTNVRSMNNALSCGYRPLWFIAPVYVPSDMTR